MNVTELFQLTQWITEEIEGKQVAEKYSNLQAIIQKHAQPNQQKPPFETEQNTLLETLADVPLSELSLDQIDFLGSLGITDTIGKEGINNIENNLERNFIDVATVANNLAKIAASVKNGVAKSNQIKAGLNGCIPTAEYDLDGEILMRVSFSGDAKIAHVEDFKNWGKIWFEIARGITMVNDAAPQQVRVVGATRGSVILELAVSPEIAATMSAIIYGALQLTDKVLEIRKKAAEIKGMNLSNKQLEKDLIKSANDEKKSGADKIAIQIIDTLNININLNNEGDKVVQLKSSTKKLVDFLEKGGVVDFVDPDESEEDDESEQLAITPELREEFRKIRQLESKILQIEQLEDDD